MSTSTPGCGEPTERSPHSNVLMMGGEWRQRGPECVLRLLAATPWEGGGLGLAVPMEVVR